MKQFIAILLLIPVILFVFFAFRESKKQNKEDKIVIAEEKKETGNRFFQVGLIIEAENETLKEQIKVSFSKDLEKLTDVDVEVNGNKEIFVGRNLFIIRFSIEEIKPTNELLSTVIFTKMGNGSDLDFSLSDYRDSEQLDTLLSEKEFYIDYCVRYFDINTIDVFTKNISEVLNESILEPKREDFRRAIEILRKRMK